MKNILIGLVLLALVGVGAYFFLSKYNSIEEAPTTTDETGIVYEEVEEPEPVPFEVVPAGSTEKKVKAEERIGASVEGKAITAYHFGTGDTEVLFVGGIHSAFAPNTVAVMDELVSALKAKTIEVPDDLMVTVIPNLNPDANGSPDTLAARLNANEVDLNRNFDCEWDAEGVWQNQEVSGGESAFSEPEAAALRDYIEDNNVAAAVVYYAADGGVYASNCGGGLNAEISTLTSLYADASGYTANDEFDAYTVNGDATNWMAKIGVPAIGVLLSDYTDTEWTENMAGIEAVLAYYSDEEPVTGSDEE